MSTARLSAEQLSALAEERDRLRMRVGELAAAVERLSEENRRLEAEKASAEATASDRKLEIYVLRSDHQRTIDILARMRDRLTELETTKSNARPTQ
ncbi:protein of unknown function [Methylorubrum extorquens]|uniref:Uncharacterized protein n=1 Tax=Methylorubrum extorquens TaxID=408 RepID=A0A2N9ALS6_METEX|nr:protein of unknown function [Methylorubrum extorquens]